MSKYPNLIEAGLKVGDVVDGILGELVVTDIVKEHSYPIKTDSESFTATGALFTGHKRPSIWFKSDTDWFKPPMSPPEPDHMKEFYTDRPVWVRDIDSRTWKARYAAIYIPRSGRPFSVFSHGYKQSVATGTTRYDRISYTKPEGAEDHE